MLTFGEYTQFLKRETAESTDTCTESNKTILFSNSFVGHSGDQWPSIHALLPWRVVVQPHLRALVAAKAIRAHDKDLRSEFEVVPKAIWLFVPGRLVGRTVGRPVGRLVACFIACLPACLVRCLLVGLVACFLAFLLSCLVVRVRVSSPSRLEKEGTSLRKGPSYITGICCQAVEVAVERGGKSLVGNSGAPKRAHATPTTEIQTKLPSCRERTPKTQSKVEAAPLIRLGLRPFPINPYGPRTFLEADSPHRSFLTLASIFWPRHQE